MNATDLNIAGNANLENCNKSHSFEACVPEENMHINVADNVANNIANNIANKADHVAGNVPENLVYNANCQTCTGDCALECLPEDNENPKDTEAINPSSDKSVTWDAITSDELFLLSTIAIHELGSLLSPNNMYLWNQVICCPTLQILLAVMLMLI